MQKVRVHGAPSAGVALLVALATAYVVLWVLARPPHEPTARYIGEICGAEALLLFCCSLVLAMFLRPIERVFSGLDRVVVWHRHAATVAVLLLVPHVALITSAVDPYETTLGHGLGDPALLGSCSSSCGRWRRVSVAQGGPAPFVGSPASPTTDGSRHTG